MNVLASARIAVRALRVNKLRSALTMLGIVIGVGAVITMVAVGAGAQARVAEQIQSLGSNLIVIWPGTVNQSGVRLGAGRPGSPCPRTTPSPSSATSRWSRWSRRPCAATPRSSTPTSTGRPTIQGVTPEYLPARDWHADRRARADPRGGGRGLQGRADRPDRGAEPVRRRRPARPGDPDQEGALHHHRRPGPEGADDLWAGPGRPDPDPALHRQDQGGGRQPGQGARGGHHQHQGPRRRP